jgi:hypothetical protein
MTLGLIASVVVAFSAWITAQKAGAGYVKMRVRGEFPKWSIFRSVASLAMIGLAIWLAYER